MFRQILLLMIYLKWPSSTMLFSGAIILRITWLQNGCITDILELFLRHDTVPSYERTGAVTRKSTCKGDAYVTGEEWGAGTGWTGSPTKRCSMDQMRPVQCTKWVWPRVDHLPLRKTKSKIRMFEEDVGRLWASQGWTVVPETARQVLFSSLTASLKTQLKPGM